MLIAAAGMAAHLAGALAANTTLPVIGVPVKGGAADGLDALLATVQMPTGIPVATVALNGAKNAAVLAAQILALGEPQLAAALKAEREAMGRSHCQKGRGLAERNCQPVTGGQQRGGPQWKKGNSCTRERPKRWFATDDPALVIVDYKDDATAGDGAKRGTIRGKGVVNNRLSNHMMKLLEEKGVPTHFVQELSERETLVKKVKIVPLEVIVRNVAAGSFSKAPGCAGGHRCCNAPPRIQL